MKYHPIAPLRRILPVRHANASSVACLLHSLGTDRDPPPTGPLRRAIKTNSPSTFSCMKAMTSPSPVPTEDAETTGTSALCSSQPIG